MELVRECPLRILRSEADYDDAVSMLNRLIDRGPERTSDEEEYLLALSLFVEKYDDEHFPIQPVSPPEMLRHLIETQGITQSELARATGLSNSTLSEILSGKRTINRRHMTILSAHFHVSPAVFFETSAS
jgi:HTH-type transcriptional regulator/antitoxin HigA